MQRIGVIINISLEPPNRHPSPTKDAPISPRRIGQHTWGRLQRQEKDRCDDIHEIYRLPNRSSVVIDLNVGHPNSLWPADEHSAHADRVISNDCLCQYDRFQDGLLGWSGPCHVRLLDCSFEHCFQFGRFLKSYDVLPIAITESVTELGVEPPMVGLIHKLMIRRMVTTTQTRLVNRDTSQGGVLSPLLWNSAVNKLPRIPEGGGSKVFAIADDVAIIFNGKYPQTLRSYDR